MQLLGIILAALVILAAAHAIAGVLALLLVVLLVWGLYARPFETFGLFAFALLMVIFQAHPLLCLLALTGLSGMALASSASATDRASDVAEGYRSTLPPKLDSHSDEKNRSGDNS